MSDAERTLQTSPATMGETSVAFINSVQHLYFIVAAPAVWLPLALATASGSR